MPAFKVKNKFLEKLSSPNGLESGRMFYRLYVPEKDSIIQNYDKEDWSRIFNGYTEEDLADLATCMNVIILLWCDKKTETPHGMLYIEESSKVPNEVIFHGGTWDHSPMWFLQIICCMTAILTFLLEMDMTITTTCGLNNMRANKFQEHLGFVETHIKNNTIFKILNTEIFERKVKPRYLRDCKII